MARLDPATRAELRNSAFAYVDSRGRRRLPIHDAAHVRNALARFSQVKFDDAASREQARKRLLSAAKKYGIVPLGFIDGQLQSERELGALRAPAAVQLPTGFVTMLMTDVEGSTALVRLLGERYRELINGVRVILTDATEQRGGQVVEARADDFFAVFESASSALEAAVAIQRALHGRMWFDDIVCRVRMGIHSGFPTVNEANYIGLAVHTTARICAAAHGGQILVSDATRKAAGGARPEGVRFRNLGEHALRGLPAPVALFQMGAPGLDSKFPPARTSAAD